jgi:hypothetical protein
LILSKWKIDGHVPVALHIAADVWAGSVNKIDHLGCRMDRLILINIALTCTRLGLRGDRNRTRAG